MKDNYIRANKCIIDETYYLTGMWYDYNIRGIGVAPYITSSENKPLINTPVKFIGVNHNAGVYKRGKHRFMMLDGTERLIHIYAYEDLFLEPIENPDILNPEKLKEYLEQNEK